MGSINQIAFDSGLAAVRVPMAKPSWAIVRVELPKAPDLFADRSIPQGGSSSSRRHDLVFIVNPKGKERKKLLPYLRSRLGAECNICQSLTSGPSHAIDITREAIRKGTDVVIVVGGDGTLHEVVNGFFWAGKPVTNYNREATHSTALGELFYAVYNSFPWGQGPILSDHLAGKIILMKPLNALPKVLSLSPEGHLFQVDY